MNEQHKAKGNGEEQDTMAIVPAPLGAISSMERTEVDIQVATAKQYPRSLHRFREEARSMATLTPKIAGECFYVLVRGGKKIEGPSARLAEIVASCWGNCRASARGVSVEAEYVVAEGMFYDLERNVAIRYETKRRITDREGRRYNSDMIAVTMNAACSIALRNAVFKVVPKAFWADIYEDARKTTRGDEKSLLERRNAALASFKKMKVTEEQICALLEVAGPEDIGLDELVTLRGVYTAIEEGDTTVEQAFSGAAGEPARGPKRKSEGFAPVKAVIPPQEALEQSAREPGEDLEPGKSEPEPELKAKAKPASKEPRITDKQKTNIFSVAATVFAGRADAYEKTRARVKEVVNRHGFDTAAEVTADLYGAVLHEVGEPSAK